MCVERRWRRKGRMSRRRKRRQRRIRRGGGGSSFYTFCWCPYIIEHSALGRFRVCSS
jgi:hypothetical protein